MYIVFTFFLAMLFASIGVLPPGMLNMHVATISIKKSAGKAKQFIFGACFIIAFQSFFGFYFATFMGSHPQIVKNLKLVGVIIFSVLTLFFIGKGIQSVIASNKLSITEKESSFSPFYQGIVLSLLNVFPVPYYAFLSLYFSAVIPSFFSFATGFSFVLGSVTGSGVVFFLYAILFKKWEDKVSFFINHVNFILALITGLVVLLTVFKG